MLWLELALRLATLRSESNGFLGGVHTLAWRLLHGNGIYSFGLICGEFWPLDR